MTAGVALIDVVGRRFRDDGSQRVRYRDAYRLRCALEDVSVAPVKCLAGRWRDENRSSAPPSADTRLDHDIDDILAARESMKRRGRVRV